MEDGPLGDGMTIDRFLACYEAPPQDRRDGYDAAMFAGCTPAERRVAREMLLARALQGETIDLDGLAHVGDADTIRALREADGLDAQFGHAFGVGRLETLYRLTGDPADLEGLFRYIDGDGKAARAFAAQALSRHGAPEAFAAPLADRLASGRHEDIVLPLTASWLSTQGEPMADMRAFQRCLPFMRSVMAERPSRRLALLQGRATQDRDAGTLARR